MLVENEQSTGHQVLVTFNLVPHHGHTGLGCVVIQCTVKTASWMYAPQQGLWVGVTILVVFGLVRSHFHNFKQMKQ